MKKVFTLFLIFFWLAVSMLCAQNFSHKGFVTDASTGLPVQKAKITVFGKKNLTLFTDDAGAFSIDSLPRGRYTFTVSAQAMQPSRWRFSVQKKDSACRRSNSVNWMIGNRGFMIWWLWTNSMRMTMRFPSIRRCSLLLRIRFPLPLHIPLVLHASGYGGTIRSIRPFT